MKADEELNLGYRPAQSVSKPQPHPGRRLRIQEMPVFNSANPIIGVFDSGIGGLAVARELIQREPAIPLLYLADQAHAPYGSRMMAEVNEIATGIADELIRSGAEILVLACNTASAAALYSLRKLFPGHVIVGMEPAVKPAVGNSRNRKIGILATALTLQGEPFAGLLNRFAQKIQVYTMDCPEFVKLVEEGDLTSHKAERVIAAKLSPLLRQGVDQIVLGCTHYSFLKPLIEECCTNQATVVDPSPAVAQQALHFWRGEKSETDHQLSQPSVCFATTNPAKKQVLINAVKQHITTINKPEITIAKWQNKDD